MGLAPSITKILDKSIKGGANPSRQDKMQLQCDPGGEILYHFKQYFVVVIDALWTKKVALRSQSSIKIPRGVGIVCV